MNDFKLLEITMSSILDLSNLNNQTATFSVSREAKFDNTVDFYEVNADGSVTDSNGNTIAPGEDSYAEVAIANRLQLNLNTEDGATTTSEAELTGGAFYAPMIAVNSDFSSFADGDFSNDPKVYFAYEAANIDGFNHVNSSGENQFSFEDLLNGGDRDFDDIIIDVELADSGKGDSGNPINPGGNPIELGSIAGVKFNDVNGDGVRDELIQGENPDVVFVIDVSGSTSEPFAGQSVGDINGDGFSNTRLDAELAGLIGRNQLFINQGEGDKVDVGIVTFNSTAIQVDLDPSAGSQLTTTPDTDNNGNGIPDVEEVLESINFSGDTNFEAALQAAEGIFSFLGTESGEGNLVFLSDGEVNTGGLYDDEVARLNNLDINISAFGIGSDASLPSLQIIDPGARIFTSADELLDIFGDINSNGNGGSNGGNSENTLEPGLSGVNVYLDLNENGTLDNDEPSRITDDNGEFLFENLEAATYIVREVVPNGFVQTAPNSGQFVIALGAGEAVEEINFGNFEEESIVEVDPNDN